ncbi:MAG: penicillin-binding protein activator [Alphaproteobacteria bacterium]|nr:penicillin-binding protein activator [Alphaproteobacteria bacterium]
MRIFRFLFLFTIITALAGCGGGGGQWGAEYTNTPTTTPAQMQYGAYSTYGTQYGTETGAHAMAVLLPTSGMAGDIGQQIKAGVEMAVLRNAPGNLTVSFYDTTPGVSSAFSSAMSNNPEIIIGPLFASDARTLREIKPTNMPILSFTSDASAVGDGVMTMALMPTNSVEEIVREISRDGARRIIMIAPSTNSGRTMAAVAYSAANMYDVSTVGLLYYTEKDSESIKSIAVDASMNAARVSANKRAREILSDILTTENLTAIERSDINRQLSTISRGDTLGDVPYDAVLFLGNGDDSQTIASFLRYYGVDARRVRFYGTALWDGAALVRDVTMYGAKYPALPEPDANFTALYSDATGVTPSRMATFGYDATNLAIGMLYSGRVAASYLMDPSGYVGIDGLVRLTPDGVNERGLRIMELNGTDTPRIIRPAPTNFITPIYNVKQRYASPVSARGIESGGINPMNYIRIPERMRSKYKAKTYGARGNTSVSTNVPAVSQNIITVASAGDDTAIISSDFQPVKIESVNRTYIDAVEISE